MELSGRINFKEFQEYLLKCGFNLNSVEKISGLIKKRMAVTGISDEIRIIPASLMSSYIEMLENPYGFLKRTDLPFNEKQVKDSSFIIKEGMRGSVLYGTSSIKLDPGLEGLLIYGKTGTVNEEFSNNQEKERTSGLFFGFCNAYGEKLAIFIFLYNGKGSDAAGIGLGYFAEYFKNLSD
jgi:cell division protein FtsI/penicillin-binding protein 2